MKNLLLKTGLFLTALLLIGNISAQSYQCNGDNIFNSITFQAGDPYYTTDEDNWSNTSTDYTVAWNNGEMTIHLGNATAEAWQAQFPLRCDMQSGYMGKTCLLSFDVESNVDLPRVYLKIDVQNAGDNFMDLPPVSLKAGEKITVSGLSTSTTDTFNEILFDFGGNPANADITISNMVICEDYSGETPPPPTYVCNGNNILSGVDFQLGDVYFAPNWATSSNYTATWQNDLLTLHFGDATSADWQSQVPLLTATSQTLESEKTYFLSYDIETNADLPRVYMKVYTDGADNNFIEIPSLAVKAGKQTVSGIFTNTGNTIVTQFNKILFDFGGNPANTDITISNITVCDDYSTVVTGITGVGLNNGIVVGGKSSLSATFEGEANVSVYSIQGILIKKAIAQSSFKIDNLPAGIYLVKINNNIYKTIVQ